MLFVFPRKRPAHSSDLIEMGVDILNPVHVTTRHGTVTEEGFGKDLVFWGGGVDTRDMFTIRNTGAGKGNLKRNIEALAPGGGYLFGTIHNIQAEVPPQNVAAMLEALKDYGKY